MAADLWISIGLGGGLGLLYGVVAYLFSLKALGASREQFLKLVFGGLMIRIFGSLAVMLIVLVTIPVRQGSFVGSFLGVLVLATTIEIYSLHSGRRSRRLEMSQDGHREGSPEVPGLAGRDVHRESWERSEEG